MNLTASTEPLFRFDADRHVYTLNGERRPSISQMLKDGGLVDATFMTEEGRARGSAVHRLTADYDLGAIEDPASVTSLYKGWLLAHVAAMKVLKPDILEVEEPHMHPRYEFGGRPDRVAKLWGLLCTLEGKTGGRERWHPIQTALQAILIAHRFGLKPDQVGRYCVYIQSNGKFKVERHINAGDFTRAQALIREFCPS
jgi:hypothetical protein